MEHQIAVAVLRLVVMVAAVLGNGMILFVVARNRKLQQRGANTLFAQLALADLLIGLGVGIRACATIVFAQTNTTVHLKGSCLLLGSTNVVAIHLSQTTMMAIAFDRFFCIQFPLFYRRTETLRFAFFRFLFCNLFSIAGASLAFVGLDWNGRTDLCAFGSSIPHWYVHYWNLFSTLFTFLIYALYITIFVVYKTRIQTIHSATQRSLFRTITAILTSYFFLWAIPNFVIVLGNVLGTSPTVFGYLSLIVGFGSGLNASTNIFIYGSKHSELGAHLKKTLSHGFRCFCGRKKDHATTFHAFSTERWTTERRVSAFPTENHL